MFASVDPASVDPQEASSRERLQRAVGSDYRVGRLLGRGGFAEVFAAHEPRLSRTVAIKTVRPDLGASRELLDRFQREACAMAGLRHPNVMDIYTVGESGGVAYFVMPLVEGESLKSRIVRGGALPLDDACRILIEAASALDAAHRAGTVHRDVKPDNIMLEGEAARVLITDFGIAKALSGDVASNTTSGVLIGTPQYMSPEQATGDDSDHRSDIYSLGVVGFEMVTGRPPFQARTVQAVIAKHLTEEAPPLRTLRPDCPERLARVVERCLAKDPGSRWPSLAEVIDVLEAADDRASSTALASTASEAAFAPVRALRRKTMAGLGALVVIVVADLVLGLGGVSAWLAIVGVGYVAARAGRLWRDGYDWGDLLLGPRADLPTRVGSSGASLSAAKDEDFGRFGTLVRTVVSDRAAIMNAYAAVPRQEQNRLQGLPETVEGLVTRAKHLARKVINLESRVAEAAARMERSPSADELRDFESSPRARSMARLHELSSARDDAARELHACIGRLDDVRGRMSGSALLATGGAVDDTARVLSAAAAYLSQRVI